MGTITNYATLQSTIADYLNRADLTSQIQTFIQFVEADLNTRLRNREMIVNATATSDGQFVALPPDWLEAINMMIVGGQSPLRYITPDEADTLIKAQTYTSTKFYSMTTGVIELVPPAVDDITIDMVYYGKIPALSNANTTNWLLTKAPDVYLYGALSHAAPFLMDDARMGTFGQIYLARVQSLQDESQKALHSGSPLISRPRGVYG
ncbi:hypothetical protein UFOVP1552_40 [uncultured Caudovirales phage]|uniref:Uncharacterized protein n=1 Tax=uncultured Caudovirales phage TaxID=2100421 RepID=A0A6J5Q063_9CAUD|nr:hypothetical protein UFOVP933_10 [uncultured Caudovirales phage]CAB4177509.1 hypothetical protein UFOVP1014_5 [uncultured Caudovirales phage]CAB4202738.1 hypothetical protein UFOVP1368_33 [uncultured Caudovirales phage]CAB5229323.1 hypothetical protein UFOVP1552_40 [uncultured Caudovirales phage]